MTRHYYITGIDGIGKTTQANLLQSRLESSGSTVKRVWFRFPVFLSLPILVFARLRGYTKYEWVYGTRVGAWRFSESRFLKAVFPWFQLLDTVLLSRRALWRADSPSTTILFERFVLDVLIDLMAAVDDPHLHRRFVGRKLLQLIPKGTRIAILDAPIDEVRSRRKELLSDPSIARRARMFQLLADDLNIAVIDGQGPTDVVALRLKELFDQ